MISIIVYKQSNYPVSAKKIKDVVKKIIKDSGIVSDTEASVAMVGKNIMTQLVKEYLNEDASLVKGHTVLSFPASETTDRFIFPPDGKIHLGEIVISYPKAVEEANKSGVLLENVIMKLVEHGTKHLVGINHD